MKAEDSAIEVEFALNQAGSVGLTIYDLVSVTGLSYAQVRRGIRHYNHVRQINQQQPIAVVIAGQNEYRYILPDYYIEMTGWSTNRMRDLIRRLRTERGRLIAAKGKWPKNVARTMEKDFDRLIQDAEDVLQDI